MEVIMFSRLFRRRLKPLPPLEHPRDKQGRYIKFNKKLERARLIREGK